ncbi:MAG: hypothetical protein Crog4KO_24020 [Crocinitomicaceae bacterium]
MKQKIIAGIDKVLNSSTSQLSSEDRLELEKIKELISKAKTKEDALKIAESIAKILGIGIELLM